MSMQDKNLKYNDYITQQQLKSLKKIKTFKLHSWQSLTNDYLIVSTSPKDKYLVEVNGHCPELRFAHGIIVNRTIGSILSTKFDSISVISSPQMKCYIKSIHQLTKEQATEIVAIGKTPEKNS